MTKILAIVFLVPYSILIVLSYALFRLFGPVTWPLRRYWSIKGRKLQKELNKEHGTHIRYGKCNLR